MRASQVSDFGLSKSGLTFYGGDEGLPTAWMSPESLQARSWSEKSDVWAFGVTLWELFSCGDIPFANLDEKEISEKILAGERLECPAECPQEVYKVMQICWQKRAEDRPPFRSLRIVLRDAERDVSVADALANARSSSHASSSSSVKSTAAASPSGGDNDRGGGSALGRDSVTGASRVRSGSTSKSVPDHNTMETSKTRIDTTIRRMATAVDNAKIQEDGARALANLAGTSFGRTHIARARGIEALVTAMKTHTQVQQVQECAVAALSNLSASSADNQSKIAERGGIVVLIKAMQEHRDQPLVQQYGATALRNLTLHNAENKKAIAQCRGIDALVTAMQRHPQVHACLR